MTIKEACKYSNITEDSVRDGYAPSDGSEFIKGAKSLLGFDIPETNVDQGTGQIKSFHQLGFTGKNKNNKPDGWYLPKDKSKVAIILETKSSDKDLNDEKWINELKTNINVALQRYNKVIGILYNGHDLRVFKNNDEVNRDKISDTLQNKEYYIKLWTETPLDTKKIIEITQRINNNLHFKLKMPGLQDRMIFTACALVAQRFNPVNGLQTQIGQDYDIVHGWVTNKLAVEINKENNVINSNPNRKLNILLEEYNTIKLSDKSNQEAINNFINDVCEIAQLVNSDYWNGEDVMGIFFNEFNAYLTKSEMGQVFTPDHITSFMYRLLGVTKNDKVFDGTCGSGAFLVKAMSNMIKEAGGESSNEAKIIKSERLYGIELDRKIYALACANMLIHKDGKTNIIQARCEEADSREWIRTLGITKVLMNPPYERNNNCMDIVESVLNSVDKGTQCAFILPEKKLEKDKKGQKIIKKHRLTKIIKLPEKLFFGIGVTTSIYVFIAGEPQKDNKIIGYYIEDDGLETVKKKGRQDVKHIWHGINGEAGLEDYWISAICDETSEYFGDTKYNTRQIIDPKEHLSYQMPEKPFEISEEDFKKTAMDYICFKQGIGSKEEIENFKDNLFNTILYTSDIRSDDNSINIKIKKESDFYDN